MLCAWLDFVLGLFPLIIFMGVGAMTDFGPLIANPKTALLGGAAQFGPGGRAGKKFTSVKRSHQKISLLILLMSATAVLYEKAIELSQKNRRNNSTKQIKKCIIRL